MEHNKRPLDDRIDSIEEASDGVKTTLEGKRKETNRCFQHLEDMVGDIPREIMVILAKVLWIHQLLHMQLKDVHLRSIGKTTISANIHKYTQGTTYASRWTRRPS